MIEISKDKNRLDVNFIHAFLTETYWAKGRTIEEVQKSINHSLCFGVYLDNEQIGFARIATDYTVFAYLMDVFIDSKYRSKGYSKELMKTIIGDKELSNCKVWMLRTDDAHGLYRQFEFKELTQTEIVMERILQ